MIKRIRKVKGVGTFSDFKTGGPLEFGKFTVIYGQNCYGKSTLCDTFRCLSTKDSDLLNKRKTDQDQNIVQEVEIGFELQNKEYAAIFKNDSWNTNGFNYNIEVFDARFVNDNVFTGLEIDRRNKENITDFILGAENVKIAKELEALNQNSRKVKKQLSDKIKTLEELVPQLKTDDFVRLKVIEQPEEIADSLTGLSIKKGKLEKNIEESDKILSKKEPDELELEIKAIEILDKINELLKKGFQDINQAAAEKIAQHIEANFVNKDGAEENWIKQGLTTYCDISQVEKSNCPLCGQSLKNSIVLIKAYQDYFNEEYNSFMKAIETNLNKYLDQIKSENLTVDIFPK